MEEKQTPAYYAILSADVRYDKKITPNAKLLYAEITALTNQKGYCWSSNSYFAELYGVSNTSISKWISQLVENGYLTSQLIYKDGTKEILNRYLRLVKGGIEENLNTPIEDKLKDNTTLLNTTSNISLCYVDEEQFLKDWNEARVKVLKVKASNISFLTPQERTDFNLIKDNFTIDQFKNGMRGLLKQKDMYPSNILRPKHFLSDMNIEKYIDAFVNESQLYETKNKYDVKL